MSEYNKLTLCIVLAACVAVAWLFACISMDNSTRRKCVVLCAETNPASECALACK